MDYRAVRKLRMQGIAEGRVLTGPQTVHIDLANGCNTNCVTCWDHSPLLLRPRTAQWKRRQMSLEVFMALAADLAGMGSVEAVILSGMGDPFVNPEIYRMVEVCKRYGWHVTILTNLLLADAERVIELGVDDMLISVNGVTPESYTAFHPNLRPSDYERLCRLLTRFQQAGRRFKHVQVINRDTAPELVEMVRFAHRYGARSITYKLASLGHGTQQCAITAEQRQQMLESLIPQACFEAISRGVETNLDVLERQLGAGAGGDLLATAPIAEVGCFMGWSYARVTVDGRLLFCCSTEVEVGSLAEGLFSEQWYGERWNGVRQRLMRGDYYPSCSQCGKLNQNVKIGQKVRRDYGEQVFLERIGRGSR